jgi:hypothetical protein
MSDRKTSIAAQEACGGPADTGGLATVGEPAASACAGRGRARGSDRFGQV